MLVERVLSDLQSRVAGASMRMSDPVYALSSWYIDLEQNGFRVTVEYVPMLGLFGISSPGALDGAEEIYRDSAEVVDRVAYLAAWRRSCTRGRISDAAYDWSRQEIERLPPGSPEHAEHSAIVKAFEAFHASLLRHTRDYKS
jgi:hypothetical protein